MNKIWKDIPGYEGLYQINKGGQIKSLPRNGTIKTPRLLKFSKREGYYYCILSKNNNPIKYNIHRLVAKTFIPNPQNKKEVNHKNGIKTDNRMENLEWCTAKENTQHAFRASLRKHKLTATEVLEIRKQTEYKDYSIKLLCEKYQVKQQTIIDIILYRKWRFL